MYLSKRTRDSKPKQDKKKKKEAEVVEVENIIVETVDKKKKGSFLNNLFKSLFGEDNEEISETEELLEEKEMKDFDVKGEEMPPKKEKGFFSRLFSWMEGDDQVVSKEVEKKAVDLNEDLKDALKIQNKWLQKLSGDKIREFKGSGDYKRYKEILEKYDLIKK